MPIHLILKSAMIFVSAMLCQEPEVRSQKRRTDILTPGFWGRMAQMKIKAHLSMAMRLNKRG